MFEAVACGQKPLVFENYFHQKYAIKFFKKCYNLRGKKL